MDSNEIADQVQQTTERAGWNERRIEILDKSVQDLYEQLEECRKLLKILTEKVERMGEEE